MPIRKELLLGDAGPRSSWLRIESGTQWAEESARVRARLAGQAIDNVSQQPSTALAETSGHVQAIEATFGEVEATLQQRFPELAGVDAALAPNAAALLGPANAQALEGLSVMRDLAFGRPSAFRPTRSPTSSRSQRPSPTRSVPVAQGRDDPSLQIRQATELPELLPAELPDLLPIP